MAKRFSKGGAGPSQRQLRVGELVRHALSDMLSRGEIHDDVLEGHLVTVPEVRMSPDLKLATAFILPLGGGDVKEVLVALEQNKKFIRGEVAHRVNLKYAPDIRFREDDSFSEGSRIDALLDSARVQADVKKAADESDEA